MGKMNKVHRAADLLGRSIERYHLKKQEERLISFREEVRARRRQKAYDTAMDFLVEFCKCNDCADLRQQAGF